MPILTKKKRVSKKNIIVEILKKIKNNRVSKKNIIEFLK
jgi:predicted transcriptional regulator